MVLSGLLGKSYNALEGGFYKIMDFFETHGIPVYNYNDFLESKGVPVFPFTLAIIAVLLTAIGWFFFLVPSSADVTLELQDADGNPLDSVNLSVFDSSGKELYSGIVDHQQKITLQGVKTNDKLSVQASKKGFESANDSLELNGTKNKLQLSLSAQSPLVAGQVQLLDEETETIIQDGKITATLPNNQTIVALIGSDGIARLNNIPSGKEIALRIEADNYELLQTSKSFQGNQVNRVYLTPTISKSGKSSVLFQVFDEKTKRLVPLAKIQVLDAQSGSIISSVTAGDGTFSFELQPGKAYRYVVQKEGYATADSSVLEKNFTPRNDEEIVPVFLSSAGASVRVTVLSKSGQTVIPNAVVTLYNVYGEVLDSNGTQLGGVVEFNALDSNESYFVGAHAENYLPSSQPISPGIDSEVTLSLESVSSSNSANVNVFVSDDEDRAVAGAALQFYQQNGEWLQPVGLPTQQTDIAGYFSKEFPLGLLLVVRASKETAVGEGNVSVSPGNNELRVTVSAPSSIVGLVVLDELGNPVQGTVLVESVSGNVLFDGALTSEGVSFDALGNNAVKVKVTQSDGKTWEETVNVSGKSEVVVGAGLKESNQNAPQIKFIGIEGEDGSEQDGLVRGKEALLVFEVNFPKASFAGLHFRVGSDSSKSVESQSVAITGFSADPSQFFYGRTYNAFPSPGIEGVDFQNAGIAGKSNKWLELYYPNASGTKIVKVRVLEKDATNSAQEEVHVRSWSRSGSAFYRNPEDAVLGESEFNSQKLGLYAETIVQRLNVYDSIPSCDNALCASFSFLDDGGNEIEPENFKAIVGKLYALQETIRPKTAAEAQLSASTSAQNPLVSFTGTDVENFGSFPDSGVVNTSSESVRASANAGESVRTRFYFKALGEGSAFIKTSATAGNESVSKTFYFETFAEKPLTVIINPKAVVAGQHFMVRVSDDQGNAIENALVSVKDAKGKTLYSVQGIGAPKAGLNGFYEVQNSFEPGSVSVGVKAPGYQYYETIVEISRAGILSLPDTIAITIPGGQGEQLQTIEVSNRSKEGIESVAAEFVPDPSFPSDLALDVDAASAVAPRGKSNLSLIARFDGERERATGAGTLIVTGKIAGQYSVSAQSRVTVEYNPVVSSDCLEFNVQQLSASLLNDLKSSKQLEFKAKNHCAIPLNLQAFVDGDTRNELEVSSEPIALEPKQEQNVRVTVTNAQQRMGADKRNYSLTIRYQSDALSKSIPLKVSVFHPRFAVQAPEVIHLYLAQSLIPGREFADRRAKATYPIYIKNTGNADITNLTVSHGSYGAPGVDLIVTSGEFASDPFLYQGSQYGGASLVSPNYNPSSALYNTLYNTVNAYNPLSNPLPVLGGSYPLQSQYAYQPGMAGNPYYVGGGSVGYQPYYGYPKSSASIPLLPRGQSVTPPLLLFAAGDAQKSGDFPQQLIIEGTIDGRNVPLRTINVFIHVSAPSCLKVNPTQLSISETEAGQGVSGQTITVTNTCSEDARVTDLEPKTIGGNGLSFIPLDFASSGLIPRNGRARYQLLVTKNQAIDTTQEVTFFAVLAQSGKAISLEPLSLELELGEKADKPKIVSVEKEVGYCDNPTEKIKLKFPKIAQGNQGDCSTSYCDAEQLANYVARKIDKKVQEAETAISQKGNEAGLICSLANACLFHDLGVKDEIVTVYLSNDNVSVDLLQQVIESDQYGRIKGFNVQSSIAPLESIAGRGYGRQLLYEPIQGCGRYKLRIQGAVESPSLKLQRGRETVVLHVEDFQKTPECRLEIQNFLNYLPQDGSLDYDNKKESWLGMVEKPDDKKLELISKEFSKSLFGKETRLEDGVTGTNTLDIQLGSLEGRIVRVTLPEESDESAPIRMTATINQVLLTMRSPTPNANIPLEAAQEAGKAIRSFAGGAPIDGSCVSKDLKSIEIQSAAESSRLSLNACGGGAEGNGVLRVSVNQLRSCDLNVSSALNTTVSIEVKQPESAEDRILGIEEHPYVVESMSSATRVQSNQTFSLKLNNKTKQYEKGFKLAAKGTRDIAELFNEQAEVEVVASDKGLGFGDVTKTVQLQACGEHPYDLLQSLNAHIDKLDKTNPRQQLYATLVWGEGKDSFKLGELTSAAANGTVNELRGALSNKIYSGTGIGSTIGETQEGRDAVASRYRSAIGAYALACGLSHGIGDAALGLLTFGAYLGKGLMIDLALDCGLPSVIGLLTVYNNQYPQYIPSLLQKAVYGISWGSAGAANVVGASEDDGPTPGPGEAAFGSGAGGRLAYTLYRYILGDLKTQTSALDDFKEIPSTVPLQEALDQHKKLQDQLKATQDELTDLTNKLNNQNTKIAAQETKINNLQTTLGKTRNIDKQNAIRQEILFEKQQLVDLEKKAETIGDDVSKSTAKVRQADDVVKNSGSKVKQLFDETKDALKKADTEYDDLLKSGKVAKGKEGIDLLTKKKEIVGKMLDEMDATRPGAAGSVERQVQSIVAGGVAPPSGSNALASIAKNAPAGGTPAKSLKLGGRYANWLKNSPKFKLAMSLGIGVAANYFGFQAYKKSLQSQTAPNQVVVDASCDIPLERYQTYLFTIEKDEQGAVNLACAPLTSTAPEKAVVIESCEQSKFNQPLSELPSVEDAPTGSASDAPAAAAPAP